MTRQGVADTRRDYARQWWEIRRTIRLCHKAGLYGAAASLRAQINLLQRCFQHV
jgi:hypothetical protein